MLAERVPRDCHYVMVAGVAQLNDGIGLVFRRRGGSELVNCRTDLTPAARQENIGALNTVSADFFALYVKVRSATSVRIVRAANVLWRLESGMIPDWPGEPVPAVRRRCLAAFWPTRWRSWTVVRILWPSVGRPSYRFCQQTR